MTSPSQPTSDQGHRDTPYNLSQVEIELLIKERTAALRTELEGLQQQNKELRKLEDTLREKENELMMTLDASGAGWGYRGQTGAGWPPPAQCTLPSGLCLPDPDHFPDEEIEVLFPAPMVGDSDMEVFPSP